MACYGYVRLPEDGSEQDEACCWKLATRLKIPWSGTFQDSFETYRTALFSRPAGQRILSTISAGNTLIFSKLDDFASVLDAVGSIKVLGNSGVLLWIEDLRFNTRQLMDMADALDRLCRRTNYRLGLYQRKLRGQVRGTPVGYRWNANQHLEPCPIEWSVSRLILTWRQHGMGILEISSKLPPGQSMRNGKPWDAQAVRRALLWDRIARRRHALGVQPAYGIGSSIHAQ